MLLRLADSGQDVPALRHRAVLYDDLRPVYDAFLALNVERPIGGMGTPMGLPTPSVVAYLDLHGITDPLEREEWYSQIKALDAVYLDHVRKKE